MQYAVTVICECTYQKITAVKIKSKNIIFRQKAKSWGLFVIAELLSIYCITVIPHQLKTALLYIMHNIREAIKPRVRLVLSYLLNE
jgi:hypothetical protein